MAAVDAVDVGIGGADACVGAGLPLMIGGSCGPVAAPEG